MLAMRGLALLGFALASVAAAPPVAPKPSVLAQALPGLWEFSGAPGGHAPVRQCVADIARLAQFEHRAGNCARTVISDSAGTAVVQYQCGAAGFGRSDIHLITPRSLKISTQGISDNMPFNYVLQAHRVGDCTKIAATPRH
jgi:uncharacterized protein DUF3617